MSTAVVPTLAGVQWSRELSDAFVGDEQPGADVCRSAQCEILAIADRLVAGDALMNADRTAWVTPLVQNPQGTGQVPEVGRWLNAADLRPDDSRTEMVLALAQMARKIGFDAGAPRQGGWVQLAAGGVALVVVGVAIGWLANSSSTASQAVRVRQGAIVEAGRLQSERLRVAAQTGQPMAPPGPVELAAAADIRESAREAREAGIGQSVEEAVSSVTKAVIVVGALWAGVQLFGK